MSNLITVIKAKVRTDLWDFNTNKPLPDTIPIGYTMSVDGAVPEGFIKWVPNKIFDKRKYPELYALFSKDHLPNDLELKCFVQKNYHKWHPETTIKKFSIFKMMKYTFFTLLLLSLGVLFLMLM